MLLALHVNHDHNSSTARCCLDIEVRTPAVGYQLAQRCAPHEINVHAVAMPDWPAWLAAEEQGDDPDAAATLRAQFCLVALPWRHDYWFERIDEKHYQLRLQLPITKHVDLALTDLEQATDLDELFAALDHLAIEQRRAGFSCWEASATAAAPVSPAGSDRIDGSVPSLGPALPVSVH